MNGDFHVTRRHDVLDFEVVVVDLESHSLDDFSIFAAGQLAVFFGLGSGDDHFTTTKN